MAVQFMEQVETRKLKAAFLKRMEQAYMMVQQFIYQELTT